MAAPVPNSPFIDLVSNYPPWLLVACATLVAAVLLWLLGKAIRWALWLLAIAVIVVGSAAAIWLVFR